MLIICKNCTKEYEVKRIRIFCSNECKYEFRKGKTFSDMYGSEKAVEMKNKLSNSQKGLFAGDKNPRFGKKKSDVERKKISDSLKKNMTDERRYNCGNSNRNKKFSEDRIKKMHGHRTIESYSHIPNIETRNKIGLASSLKYKDENFRLKYRKIMEEKGHYVPLKDKTDFEIYKNEANWISKMWDLFDIKHIEVYNSFLKNSSTGMVRDHIYSRLDGFRNSIFPEILRHPANCQLLTHSDNVKKRWLKNNITIEDLFLNIQKYDNEWIEHDLVLSKIKDYKDGLRWFNKYH